jgi:predicted peroxiredoxin
MPFMPGLTIIVAGADRERFHAALSLAAANAALGERTRLFLQGEAVRLLAPAAHATDEHYHAHGIPSCEELLQEALALGTEIKVCQSGLAMAGMSAEALPTGIMAGGLVELLAKRGEDQLVMA